ncbi:MAG: nucleotidyltransferase domain-containing protein [Campylobacterales bacterium]|nr:nucleotidyltransferase domain-containing protein [Campylobacterales bacterium]
MDKNDILHHLKELKPQLESDGILSLGLFGSYARGEEEKDSDIDIILETTDEFKKKFVGWNAFVYMDENIRNSISSKFSKNVDIFDKNSNSPIKESVLSEAIYA